MGADTSDGMTLVGCRIANAVRCVPPANLPIPAEVATCNRFLTAEMVGMTNLSAVLSLGVLSHCRCAEGVQPANQPDALPARCDP